MRKVGLECSLSVIMVYGYGVRCVGLGEWLCGFMVYGICG